MGKKQRRSTPRTNHGQPRKHPRLHTDTRSLDDDTDDIPVRIHLKTRDRDR